MRDYEGLTHYRAIFEQNLHSGDLLKHELKGILVLERVVHVDLVLENLACVVAKEGPYKVT